MAFKTLGQNRTSGRKIKSGVVSLTKGGAVFNVDDLREVGIADYVVWMYDFDRQVLAARRPLSNEDALKVRCPNPKHNTRIIHLDTVRKLLSDEVHYFGRLDCVIVGETDKQLAHIEIKMQPKIGKSRR